MKNKQLKLLIVILIFFLCLFIGKYGISYAIYRDVLNTKVYLSILDPNTTYTITLNTDGGDIETTKIYKTINEPIGLLPTPTKTNYNFIGWYTTSGDKISSDMPVTSDITLVAHWAPVVCKKATLSSPLHTETCKSDGYCKNVMYYNSDNTISYYSAGNTITYGTYPDEGNPLSGYAYDCDVIGNGTYERFYFIRENTDNSTYDNAVLIYYTSVDANGNKLLDSKTGTTYVYSDALNALPTSTLWGNTNLATFDGKVARFPTLDDLDAACGAGAATVGNQTGYLDTCQFFMEHSRFQSSNMGRAGIWVQMYNSNYYRIHTQSREVQIPDRGASSDNTVRPVIEIPYNTLEGYKERNVYRVTFDSQGGSHVNSITRYENQALGTLPTPTKEGYTFAGWFTDNENYTTEVTSETLVTGTVTLYAKWTEVIEFLDTVFYIPGSCTFNGSKTAANSGNITSDSPLGCVSTINPSGDDIDYTDVKYIDTHISLFSEENFNRDFEIGITVDDFVADNTVDNQITLVNSKLENKSKFYPGFVIRRFSGTNIIEVTERFGSDDEYKNNFTYTSGMKIKLMRQDGVMYYAQDDNEWEELQDINSFTDYFNLTTWIGASTNESNSSSTGENSSGKRYYKGTLSNIYIKLEQDAVKKTVTFVAHGGTASFGSAEIYQGSAIGTLPTAEKTGYYFDGWYTSEYGGRKIDETEVITGDVTFHAHYKDIYYITFNTHGGTLSTNQSIVDVPDGYTIDPFPTASKPGYYFDGWYSEEFGGTKYQESDVVTADATYHAHYKEIRTITFITYGGTLSISPNTLDVADGSTISSLPTAEKTGYYFDGWYSEEIGGTKYQEDDIITSDATYHAHYKNIYTVTFEGEGGVVSITPNTMEIVDGNSIGSANMPIATQSGYDFVGWFSAATGGTEYDGTEIITSNATYHAQWVESQTYEVSFDSRGGSSVPSIYVPKGGTISSLPADPVKTDYTFDGWYEDETITTEFDLSTPITDDITLYAKWVLDSAYVAQIGNKYYQSLDAAFDDITTNTPTTIIILQDIAMTTKITIPENRDITLNIGNHVISNSSQNVFENNGILRIHDGIIRDTAGQGAINNNAGASLYISGGLVENTSTRQAVYNKGALYISGDAYLKTKAVQRGAVDNEDANATIEITGGTIESTDSNSKTGALRNVSGTVTITGGTIISNSTSSSASEKGDYAAAIYNKGTLIIGTKDGNHDTTTVVVQAKRYGVYSTTNYSFYDGIIKGVTAAVNDESKITGTEDSTQIVNDGTEVISGSTYNTLYYELVNGYRITFDTHGGTVNPQEVVIAENSQVGNKLPTPIKENNYFVGWYEESSYTTLVESTTVPDSDTTYHARWIGTVSLANISNDEIDLLVNGTDTINVTNSASIEGYTFSSENTSIATVNSSGVVTAHSVGVTRIALTGVNSGDIKYVTVRVNIANDIETFDIIPRAMRIYFDNVSTWAVGQTDSDHSSFDLYMSENLEAYDCVNFGGDDRQTKSKATGTVYCDLPNHYDTGVTGTINVYEYDLTNNTLGNAATYVTAKNGELYNFIPGKVYYWESQSDNTKNGKIYAYGERRIIQIDNLKSGSSDTYFQTRNVRDLGGIPVTYEDASGDSVSGTIKYGKLFRGEKIWGGSGNSLQYFTKLGINHEMDLRKYSEPNSSEEDSFAIANKIVGPSETKTYEIVHYGIDFNSEYMSNYLLARNALIEIMNEFIADPNYSLYLHCRIGSDRTGTIAYLLEGLLGVSEEDRYRDYELSVFYGLDERTRFYTNKTTNYVKFVHMKKAIRDAGDGIHEDVLAWFLAGSTNQAADMALVQQFRSAMVTLN